MNNKTQKIVQELVKIVENNENAPLDQVGSYIVGATIVRDDIEKHYEKYPLLEEIAEHGSELETLEDNNYSERLLNRIKRELNTLVFQVTSDSKRRVTSTRENKKILLELKKYALYAIDQASKSDSLIRSISLVANKYINISNKIIRQISNAEADMYTKYRPDVTIGYPFTEQEARNYHLIGEKVLEVATSPKSNIDSLVSISEALYPLLSQDRRTIDMGHDLREYMDWYFNKTTTDERKKHAKELMQDWTI